MKKHFVTFFSPGTFVAETSEREIDAWDVDAAVAMSRGIKERYGATPYAFRFSTRTRGPNDLDSKVSKQSCYYFLGGQIITLKELKKRADPRDAILISNMECNKWSRVVQNTNSYRWTQPLNPKDVVLDIDMHAPKEK